MVAQNPPQLIDPVELVRQLDPVTLSTRLDQIDRERQALLVLLRAARRVRPLGASAGFAGTATPTTNGGAR